MAGSPLKRPAQLKGESVAVAQGSSAHYPPVASLKKAGLTPKDVTLTYLQPADALAAARAKAWAKETGLPDKVAMGAVKRTRGTAVAVAVDKAAVASEQRIVDTFAALKLIPRSFGFGAFVDPRFNGDLPPSGTAPRTYGKGH